MKRACLGLLMGVFAGCTPAKVAEDDAGSGDGEEEDSSLEPPQDLRAAPLESMGSILEVRWTQVGAGERWLEYSVDEGVWLQSPPVRYPDGEASALALGLPFASTVQVRLAWAGGTSEVISAETGELPEGAPRTATIEGDSGQWDPLVPWVLTCLYGENDEIDGSWSIIVDRQGRTVWALENEARRISLQTQPSYDGSHLLIDQNSFWGSFDYGEGSTVQRVRITGEVQETLATPRLHHPFTELADGSLAWGAIASSYRDETLEILHPDGTQETLWSCAAFLSDVGASRGNYCGSNTLFWSPEAGTFLYSFYSFETMVEIDATTGKTLRYFGHVDDGAWAFGPPEAAFWWQHGGHYTADGTLLVSSKDEDGGTETVFREYRLDEGRETLVEVRSFGQGQGIYADVMGEADYTPGGSVLHNYGDAARLREVSADGAVTWDISWNADYIGRTTPIADLYTFQP